MTIKELVARRNRVQYKAEQAAAKQWQLLGAANRNIERVITGALTLTPGIEAEITKCLDYVEERTGDL